MSLKALIFDVDGTLVNTEADGHLVAFNKAFKQFGLDWHWSKPLYYELLKVTGGKERILHYIKQYQAYKPYDKHDDLIKWIANIHAVKTQYFTQISTTGKLPLRLGVKRLLDEALSKGVIIAIATTTTLDNVEALVQHNLGQHYLDNFAVVAAGNVVPNKKPSGDIYHYTLDKLGLSATECLALEDSENGILAAHEAGIRVIVTTNEWTYRHRFDGALLVLDVLGDEHVAFDIKGGVAAKFTKQKNATYINIDLLKEIHANYC